MTCISSVVGAKDIPKSVPGLFKFRGRLDLDDNDDKRMIEELLGFIYAPPLAGLERLGWAGLGWSGWAGAAVVFLIVSF